MESKVLFARSEHGGHRVLRVNQGIKIEWPEGAQVYDTARGAIIALYYGRPNPPPNAYDPHLAFNRYFREGRYRRHPPPPLIDVLEMFRPDPVNQVSIPVSELPVVKSSLTVHVPSLGIDLSKRALEVRKIFFAGFAGKVNRMGYDPEDVLQEVYQGILVRNMGKCPFDSRKSSFGHYVHMVTSCILSNYRRRHSRLERNEQFGVTSASGEEVDAALGDRARVEPVQDSVCEMFLCSNRVKDRVEVVAKANGIDPQFALQCFQLLAEGFLYQEIAEKFRCKVSEVSFTIKQIREVRNQIAGRG